MRTRLVLLAGLVGAAALAVAGCGTSSGTPDAAATGPAESSAREGTVAGGEAVEEIGEIRDLLDQALAKYREGKPMEAEDLVADAYLDHFESIEGALAESDPELMENLEHTIATEIRDRMRAGAPAAEVEELIATANESLDRAESLFAAESGQTSEGVSSGSEAGEEIAAVRDLLDEALAAYGAGDPMAAEDLAAEAYLEHFEGIEVALGELDRELMEELEHAIATELRTQMREGADAAELEQLVAGIGEDLDRAAELLGTGASPAAGATLAVADDVVRDPRDVPPPITRRTPQRVEVHLVAREVVADVAPGKQFFFWTFAQVGPDGEEKLAVPGPMIRVMEGDTLVVELTNASDGTEPHNLDFHAAIGPGGGGAVTEVEPGETKTLTFKALKRGAYVYHCAAEGMPWEHISHGMFGLIQVDPPGGLPSGYREFYVGQSEWYLTPSADETDGAGTSYYGLDDEKASAETPDYVTFNGHTKALSHPALFGEAMTADVGQEVRIFFVNGGPNLISSVHLIGEIFDRVYTGDPADATRNEETLLVAPGSAAVLELAALVPGEYLLVDHAVWRADKGAIGLLHVGPECADPETCAWPRDIFSPATSHSGH